MTMKNHEDLLAIARDLTPDELRNCLDRMNTRAKTATTYKAIVAINACKLALQRELLDRDCKELEKTFENESLT